ncbi:uncharacterized protein LOC117151582 [Bombus impatiens]|uniref:Uncharacterized protein LOC117151582 n=1 Tax=Bombus impatiens TaxID=132113 RepID=A0A6P8L465_BOMIM|nr:uncharacterized protein LOC117151582 [Bombus impatiens]
MRSRLRFSTLDVSSVVARKNPIPSHRFGPINPRRSGPNLGLRGFVHWRGRCRRTHGGGGIDKVETKGRKSWCWWIARVRLPSYYVTSSVTQSNKRKHPHRSDKDVR